MPTKKKTEEPENTAAAAAEAAATEKPAEKPAAKAKPAAEAPPRYVVYQKRTGSYGIAGITFPPFKPIAAPAALCDRIEGAIGPDVLRVFADEDKAKSNVQQLRDKLMPKIGADD